MGFRARLRWLREHRRAEGAACGELPEGTAAATDDTGTRDSQPSVPSNSAIAAEHDLFRAEIDLKQAWQ